MALFESIVVLLVLAGILLQVSKRFQLPYPSLLAIAGIGVAASSFLPTIILDPQLALAVFVTPALFNAAYQASPRELRRHWAPLTMLAFSAVIVTMLAIGLLGHWMANLGWAVAFTLGAIVSPPDASAASAVLNRFPLPRRTLLVLEGESLLNDATALLLFGFAKTVAMHGSSAGWQIITPLVLAIPGGALLGVFSGRLFLLIARWTSGTLSASVAEAAITFGTWIAAERLHVSPILSVVVLAITVSQNAPTEQLPRDRVQSFSLWGSLTFILGAIAFLLLGMQIVDIARHLKTTSLEEAILFGFAAFGTTVIVRVFWVFLYRFTAERALGNKDIPMPSARVSLLISWCGIRGILTIATASALPGNFPARDLIVFAAFFVVLGTLIVQGSTIGPVIKLLGIKEDYSFHKEIRQVRKELTITGISSLIGIEVEAAQNIRKELACALDQINTLNYSAEASSINQIRTLIVNAQRARLIELRKSGEAQEDVFRVIEEELDWAALAASPSDEVILEEI